LKDWLGDAVGEVALAARAAARSGLTPFYGVALSEESSPTELEPGTDWRGLPRVMLFALLEQRHRSLLERMFERGESEATLRVRVALSLTLTALIAKTYAERVRASGDTYPTFRRSLVDVVRRSACEPGVDRPCLVLHDPDAPCVAPECADYTPWRLGNDGTPWNISRLFDAMLEDAVETLGASEETAPDAADARAPSARIPLEPLDGSGTASLVEDARSALAAAWSEIASRVQKQVRRERARGLRPAPDPSARIDDGSIIEPGDRVVEPVAWTPKRRGS
jgi:hypothetical protein